MRARPHKVQVAPADLVDQQPIRLDVTVAILFPFAAEWVIPVLRRQSIALDKQTKDLT